jgi:hypothetical protein
MNRDLKSELNKINQVFCSDAFEHISAKNTPEESYHKIPCTLKTLFVHDFS